MNRSFIHALILAHFLLWMSFSWQPLPFWIIFSLSLFLLSLYAVNQEPLEVEGKWIPALALGLVSGIVIYMLFAIGKAGIVIFHIPLLEQLVHLYELVKPTELWHYLLLFAIIIPGEELFWRGFITKRLSMAFQPTPAILLGAILYSSVHIYAGSVLLLIAALVAGIFWGALYLWKRNIWLCILSHLIFDLLLLVLLPLL